MNLSGFNEKPAQSKIRKSAALIWRTKWCQSCFEWGANWKRL